MDGLEVMGVANNLTAVTTGSKFWASSKALWL